MGNGHKAEYVSIALDIIPKRDAINALKVALDLVKGHEVTEQEILEFVNKERELNGRRPLKMSVTSFCRKCERTLSPSALIVCDDVLMCSSCAKEHSDAMTNKCPACHDTGRDAEGQPCSHTLSQVGL